MGWEYRAPLHDMRFVIERVLQAPASWAACRAFDALDIDTASAVLDQAARFASGVLLPLDAVGDAEGCKLAADGSVRTPAGFRDAYRAYVDGGWPALPCDPAWGGQGLPLLLDAAVREMLHACNHAWTMYPDLLHGAVETVAAHGSDALRQAVLPRLVSGEWLAAMALTEPQAGSDLGALRTKAEPAGDGRVRVSGDKLFISGAEHDLTANIVHLVLCRLPGAPPGSKGLSLALVPKRLPDGARNAVQCVGLEHKMGIHGSATCAVRYDGALGWLVGEPGQGLAAMFVMMNSARLHVALQGLGHHEMATQNALRHAAERVQFGVPLAEHPAMRHALLRLQAMTEGLRVIAYRAALALDEAAHHADAAVRGRQGRIAALLTPLVKAFCTHHGFHGASAALQVFGGYGYVRETGIEQTVRDARVAMVYEGTNEIQAIDLVQRKLIADRGAALGELLTEWDAEAARCAADRSLDEFAQALAGQHAMARDAAAALLDASAADPQWPLRVADDLLFALGHGLLAWAWAASARAAASEPDRAWADAKRRRLRYGVQWLLPQAAVHWHRVLDRHAALPLP